MLEISERAWEVLRHGMEVAGLDPSRSAARARFVGGALRVGFVEVPAPGDAVYERAGLRLFAPAAMKSLVEVSGEHDELVLRESGESEDGA